jgi:hypothetical protein
MQCNYLKWSDIHNLWVYFVQWRGGELSGQILYYVGFNQVRGEILMEGKCGKFTSFFNFLILNNPLGGWPSGVGLGPWSLLLSRSQVRFPLVSISVG